MSQTLHLRFYECEHDGDLQTYLEDVQKSGAKVLDHHLDTNAEEAVVKLQIEDFQTFKADFQKTESADFADSLDWLEVPDA